MKEHLEMDVLFLFFLGGYYYENWGSSKNK